MSINSGIEQIVPYYNSFKKVKVLTSKGANALINTSSKDTRELIREMIYILNGTTVNYTYIDKDNGEPLLKEYGIPVFLINASYAIKMGHVRYNGMSNLAIEYDTVFTKTGLEHLIKKIAQTLTGYTTIFDEKSIREIEMLLETAQNPDIKHIIERIESLTDLVSRKSYITTESQKVEEIKGAEYFNEYSGLNRALGEYSHSEGYSTTASGDYSHAEGCGANANADYSHAEGSDTNANGEASHTEGYFTSSYGMYSHAEGNTTYADGEASHTEGNLTNANGKASHAEGSRTSANGKASHAEGSGTRADADNSHAEGNTTTAYGNASHTEGYKTNASGNNSHAEGNLTTASGDDSHAEGYNTNASSYNSHSEGYLTTAFEYSSHAEGHTTTASGYESHAEGYNTLASGSASHAEGSSTTASNYNSHSEGYNTTASGGNSHAEGVSTIASAYGAHAEGNSTIASGLYSHASGEGTIASGIGQTVVGRYNIEDNNALFIVGNGTSESNRSNALVVKTDGNIEGGLGYKIGDIKYSYNNVWAKDEKWLETGKSYASKEYPDLSQLFTEENAYKINYKETSLFTGERSSNIDAFDFYHRINIQNDLSVYEIIPSLNGNNYILPEVTLRYYPSIDSFLSNSGYIEGKCEEVNMPILIHDNILFTRKSSTTKSQLAYRTITKSNNNGISFSNNIDFKNDIGMPNDGTLSYSYVSESFLTTLNEQNIITVAHWEGADNHYLHKDRSYFYQINTQSKERTQLFDKFNFKTSSGICLNDNYLYVKGSTDDEPSEEEKFIYNFTDGNVYSIEIENFYDMKYIENTLYIITRTYDYDNGKKYTYNFYQAKLVKDNDNYFVQINEEVDPIVLFYLDTNEISIITNDENNIYIISGKNYYQLNLAPGSQANRITRTNNPDIFIQTQLPRLPSEISLSDYFNDINTPIQVIEKDNQKIYNYLYTNLYNVSYSSSTLIQQVLNNQDYFQIPYIASLDSANKCKAYIKAK